jgi:hypothetical protein
MKRIFLMLASLIILSLACSFGGAISDSSEPAPNSEKRCGDDVCDGPENAQNCPDDCTVNIDPAGNADSTAEDQEANQTEIPEISTDAQAEPVIGFVYAEISLDRTPGSGDCGIDPWFTPDCTMGIRIWWDMHMKAIASTPVLIIPDGQDRWVITNHTAVTDQYGINLNDFADRGGKYTEISIDPTVTNPECAATIEGPEFDFQVMGTRENGLTELILSANATELTQGSCMQAGFDWETNFLLYGWAVALSGDPLDLSFEMYDTFRTAPGNYTFQNEIDTNPSPDNRDHVSTRLEFICLSQEAPNIQSPVACPWEQ